MPAPGLFRPTGRDGGVLFLDRQEKYQKNAQGGFAALENPPTTGVMSFPSDDTLFCSTLMPSLVRRTFAANHGF